LFEIKNWILRIRTSKILINKKRGKAGIKSASPTVLQSGQPPSLKQFTPGTYHGKNVKSNNSATIESGGLLQHVQRSNPSVSQLDEIGVSALL
jgi:hypothetical protein